MLGIGQSTLDTFLEGDEIFFEFPPTQGLNRGIIQEQAEVSSSPTKRLF